MNIAITELIFLLKMEHTRRSNKTYSNFRGFFKVMKDGAYFKMTFLAV